MFDKKLFETSVLDGVATLTYTDKDVYKNGTEITAKVLKEVADYNSKFATEFTTVAKEVAEGVLKKDKAVNKVIVSTPYSMSARGSVDVTIDREKEFRSPVDGTISKSPSIQVRVTDPFAKVSKSKIKDLKQELMSGLSS